MTEVRAALEDEQSGGHSWEERRSTTAVVGVGVGVGVDVLVQCGSEQEEGARAPR